MQHFPFFLLNLLTNNKNCREPKTFSLPGCSSVLQKLLSLCKNAICGRERNYSFQLKHPELTTSWADRTPGSFIRIMADTMLPSSNGSNWVWAPVVLSPSHLDPSRHPEKDESCRWTLQWEPNNGKCKLTEAQNDQVTSSMLQFTTGIPRTGTQIPILFYSHPIYSMPPAPHVLSLVNFLWSGYGKSGWCQKRKESKNYYHSNKSIVSLILSFNERKKNTKEWP